MFFIGIDCLGVGLMFYCIKNSLLHAFLGVIKNTTEKYSQYF